MAGADRKTIGIPEELKEELDDAKPYDSMSYEDLFRDMLGQYEPPTPSAGGRGDV